MADEFDHVGADPPAFLHCVLDGRKVIVHDDDVCGFFGHVASALPHGNAHIRGSQGRRVVHTVT